MHGVFRRFMTVSLSPGASSRRSRDSTQASLDPLKMACINVSQRRYVRTGVENRQISVDWHQKYEVNFSLRPNAGRACWVSPAGMKTVGARTFTIEQWIPHSPRPGRWFLNV